MMGYPYTPRVKAQVSRTSSSLRLVHVYLFQDEYWQTKDRGIIQVASMDAMHRRNAWMWMYRHARRLMILHLREVNEYTLPESRAVVFSKLHKDPCWATNQLVQKPLYKRIEALVKLDLEEDWCKQTTRSQT